jgi:D-tyrosyl-tRNA(Tyr) deacylase
VRVVIQRVTRASVTVDAHAVGEIGPGLVLLVGVAPTDDAAVARRVAGKIAEMRIFADDAGRFDRSVLDTGGAALVVAQFTLLADVRKGRRPGFTDAAAPDVAAPIVDAFADALRALGVTVETGVFGAKMSVSLVNDGPVTIVLDSDDLDRPRRS